MALHLSVDGEGVDWVVGSKGATRKVILTFMAMFLWLIVRKCLSPTAANNKDKWDRTFFMAAMIVGFEVYFSWHLKEVMH